jgi:hypothetical protein
MSTRITAFLVFASFVFALPGFAHELSYFEEKYQTKLDGIAPKSDHKDLDRYYTEIAKRLGIPAIAFAAVSEKYGWKKEDGTVTGAIIRRSENTWRVLVYRMAKEPNKNTPDMSTYIQRFVEIDDTRQVVYCGEEQPK